MSKLCFYTPPFPHVKSYYDMIDTSVQYGFDSLEGFCCFEFATPDVEAAKRIKEYADSKNIKFSCFSVFTHFAAGEENIKKLKGYADVAKILGSPIFITQLLANLPTAQRFCPTKMSFLKAA